jgi:hypothetical protein
MSALYTAVFRQLHPVWKVDRIFTKKIAAICRNAPTA